MRSAGSFIALRLLIFSYKSMAFFCGFAGALGSLRAL